LTTRQIKNILILGIKFAARISAGGGKDDGFGFCDDAGRFLGVFLGLEDYRFPECHQKVPAGIWREVLMEEHCSVHGLVF
jgi:hypothetical protein